MEAVNEELLSMNEELKSKNEELKRSKEEHQSVNKELKTTNQELEAKIEELKASQSDLENLVAATDIATLFLSPDLEIQRFTPQVMELFNIRPPDMGRPLSDLTRQFEHETLIEDARKVLRTLEPIEQEVRLDEDRWFLMRVRPYRTVGETVEGVVLTFVDVSTQRRLEQDLVETAERARQRIGRHLHDAISSGITSSVMKVELVRDRLGEQRQESAEHLDEVIEAMQAAAGSVRDLPPELVPAGL